MSKGLITFIFISVVAVAAAVIIYTKQTADASRKRSDEIMRQFNATDAGLQQVGEKLDSLDISSMDSLIKENK